MLHQQQGGLFGPAVGEVEHLAAAALCQQVVDGKAAGLAIGDELDGLCAVVLQVAQGVQVAGKGGRVVGTGVGAQGAVLAHGKGIIPALGVHHPQLKGAVGVDRLALGGTAVGAGHADVVGLLLGGIYLFIIFVGFEKNNATTKDIVIPIVAVVLAICIFVFTDMAKMIACPEFDAFESLMTFVKQSLK